MNDARKPLRDMDAQFSLDSVPDLPAVMARRAAAAKAALMRWPCQRGLRYGSGRAETLNVFPAASTANGTPAPVLFFIHGGFWRSLDADLFSFVADGYVPFGAMVVVIDYPLIPYIRLPGIVDACARALIWTHQHAAEFGGDPERITICGNSAGGHLVAELACSAAGRIRPAGTPGAGVPVASAVPISGLYDLEPVTRSFQNDSLALTPAEVEGLSPLRRDYRPLVPMLVAVGREETEEFLRQTDAFAAQCSQAGMTAQALRVAGTNHISVLTEALADPHHPFNARLRELMALPG